MVDMGMFDTIHTGRRCGQTKALGKKLRDLLPGDPVLLEAVYMPGEDYGERPEATDFQIAMHGGGFVVVRLGLLVDWVDDQDPELPAYDYYGYYGYPLVTSQDHYEGWRQRWSERATQLETGIDTPDELATNRVFCQPNLADLEEAGDAEALAERRGRMTETALECRATAGGLPNNCQVCRELREREDAGVPART